MQQFFLALFLFLFSFQGFSQGDWKRQISQISDSVEFNAVIEGLLNSEEEVSVKAQWLEGLISHADNVGLPRKKAKAAYDLGWLYFNDYQDSMAIVTFARSGQYYLDIDDLESFADALVYKAIAHQMLGQVEEATQTLLPQLSKLEGKYPGMHVRYLRTLGEMNRSNEVFDLAQEYLEEAVKVAREQSLKPDLAYGLNRLGYTYYQLSMHQEAQESLEESFQLAKELKYEKVIVLNLNDLGELYFTLGNYERCIELYEEALSRSQTTEDDINSEINIARLKYKLELFDEAVALATKALDKAKEVNSINYIIDAEKVLAESHSALGDHEKTIDYFTSYFNHKDSVAKSESLQRARELDVKYKSDQQEADLLNAEIRRKRLIAGISVLAVLLLITGQLILRLRKQKRELAKVDEVKNNFFANISHEFRTPLTLINGLAEKLRKKEGASPDLTVIHRNGEQLLSLVNQILDITKIESGTLELHRQNIDLVAVADYYIQSYLSLAHDKGIVMRMESEWNQCIIRADRKALAHVLQNLLSNSLKFTQKGGVVLSINKIDQNWVGFAIRDTGVGIPEDQIDQIFDRFYQVDNSQTRNYEGTGIGLALVYELVQLSGASIKVESKIEEGTCFDIQWPAGENKDVITDLQIATPVVESAAIGQENEDNSLSEAPTILVVEDNADMQQYLKQMLKERGYKILTAANGSLGLEKAKAEVPDFIVSDWMMPEMSGPDMIEALKSDQLTSHIPCMLLTAKADDNSKISGLKIGAEAYLTKPFNTEELHYQIKNLITFREQIRGKLKGAEELQEMAIESSFLKEVKEYIMSHVSDVGLDGNAMAAQFNYSRSQFAKKLKALTNKSINNYLYELRIARAEQLLKTTELNVSEIAYECGFSDPSHFSKRFTKEKGISPKAFKESV